MDAGQGVGAARVFGVDGDDQAAIGEGGVVPGLAHAVGAEVAGLGDAGHDVAARAHAEGEEVAAAGVDVQGVVGRAQRGVAGGAAVAGDVDLSPGAARCGRRTGRAWLPGARPCAGAWCRYHARSGRWRGWRRWPGFGPSWCGVSVSRPFSVIEVFEAAGEADLAAQFLDLSAQGADDQGQAV